MPVSRLCPCGTKITNRCVIGGKVVNTQRRKFCYVCSPFGNGNGPKIGRTPTRNVQARKESVIRAQKKLRRNRKIRLINMLGGKCARCGYSRCFRALDFHHVDRSTKEFNLSNLGYTCSWDRLVKEAAKCELMCANCHREEEESVEMGR